MVTEFWDNISSGNGLVPEGTKPFQIQCWLVILGQFQGNVQDIYPSYEFENQKFKIKSKSPSDKFMKWNFDLSIAMHRRDSPGGLTANKHSNGD